MHNSIIVPLLKAYNHYPRQYSLGKRIGKLYTDFGFPVDMALDRLDMTKEAKLSVIFGVGNELVEHKRRSGAPEKALNRQRKANQEVVKRFMDTGETGMY